VTRACQIGGLLLLSVASGISDQKGSGKLPKAPRPRAEAAKPNNPKPNIPKANGQFKNDGPRLPNPLGNPVQRLMAMPPEQRERVLEKYPPQQQANLRQRLDEFDKLAPSEKARRLQLLQSFSSLAPEKQQILARQLPAFNTLPDERRKVMLKELVQLWRMPEGERQARLNSEGFKSQFSSSELQMLSDISENYPFPGK
jgi:hypothetical protein